MKLTENNAKFAVVRTAFHNGGTVSFHRSWNAALKSMKAQQGNCSCGCAAIVPCTEAAQKEMRYYVGEMPLYAELPEYDSYKEFSPYEPCK